MTTMEARKAMSGRSGSGRLPQGIEPLAHEVGTCYCCHTTIEPMVSKQWFVKIGAAGRRPSSASSSARCGFVPERFAKNFMPGWRTSATGASPPALFSPPPRVGLRRLRRGHRRARNADRLPGSAAARTLRRMRTCWIPGSPPRFAVLHARLAGADRRSVVFLSDQRAGDGLRHHLLSVARMIFSASSRWAAALPHRADPRPQCDAQGRKMSKSLGNGVDPLEIIDQYGADALRFAGHGRQPLKRHALLHGQGRIRPQLRQQDLEREPLCADEHGRRGGDTGRQDACAADQWILTRLNDTIRARSARTLRIMTSVWPRRRFMISRGASSATGGHRAGEGQPERRGRAATLAVLRHVLICLLKMLHPFMPFITDEVYRHIPGTEGTIMLPTWPKVDDAMNFPQEAHEMEGRWTIRAVRNLRAEMNVSAGRRAYSDRPPEGGLGARWGRGRVLRPPRVGEGHAASRRMRKPGQDAFAVSEAAELFILLGDLVTWLARPRATKERDRCSATSSAAKRS